MEINVMAFGQLAETLGATFTLHDVKDTDALLQELQQQFPVVNSIPFKIAVNKKIISSNTIIDSDSSIALLPPFSGG